MWRDRITRSLLAIIAVLLAVLVIQNVQRSIVPVAEAQRALEKIEYTEQQSSVACSSDGQYVYIVGSRSILVSNDHGRRGSWQLVLANK